MSIDHSVRADETLPEAAPGRDTVVIVGHGRSGTNWLMDVLDANPSTHCRSEANALEGSPFEVLPECWLPLPLQRDALEADWDRIVEIAAARVGSRDHPVRGPKAFVHEPARRLGLWALPLDGRWRRGLSLLMPRLRRSEWALPWWIGSQREMARAHLVLKLNKASGWALWLLERRPRVRVVHIVRHPGGRLNSWRNRYLSRFDPQEVHRLGRERLHRVAQVSPEWARVLPDVEAMSLAETETWFWRYVTEMLHAPAEGQPAYRLVVYEDLVSDPARVARELYAFCDLPWGPDAERFVQESAARSSKIATAWRDKLTPEDVTAVERVLDGSLMQDWWD